MQDARYFRSQAELCLELAHQVSDRRMADSLRSEAAQYFMRATELETDQKSAPPPSQGDGAGRH